MSANPTAADAVVIGAGVIGSSITLELARRGLNVVCVDKLPAAGYGSTSSSSAIVRFTYSTESSVAMSWEGLHYWRDWSTHVAPSPGEAGDSNQTHDALVEFTTVPMVMFHRSDEPEPPYLPHFRKLGIPHEVAKPDALPTWLDGVDTRQFGPVARFDDADHAFWGEPQVAFDAAIICADAGFVSDPQLAAQNLATAAMSAGASFLFKTTVVEITSSAGDGTTGSGRVSGVVVEDDSGQQHVINAPVVVNAAGPHSSRINALAGVTGDMARTSRALRREVYIGPAPEGYDDRSAFMCGDLDIGVYYRPEKGDNILVSSTEPECDELEWVDPDDYDTVLSEDEFQLNMMRTARRFPNLAIPHSKRGLVSLYDASDDWTPIYDRSMVDGFYMACGSSGNQFKNAAVAGHVMAELITAVEAGHDHDAEALVVTGRHTGMQIDLATFSRLRPVDPDGANTVLG